MSASFMTSSMQGDKSEPCGLTPSLSSQIPHIIASAVSCKLLFPLSSQTIICGIFILYVGWCSWDIWSDRISWKRILYRTQVVSCFLDPKALSSALAKAALKDEFRINGLLGDWAENIAQRAFECNRRHVMHVYFIFIAKHDVAINLRRFPYLRPCEYFCSCVYIDLETFLVWSR